MFNSRAGYADAIAGTTYTPPIQGESPPSPVPRNGSVTVISTRPMTFGHASAVTFERRASVPPSDDDIIMVTVKLTTKTRRQSYDDALPTRPPKRGFLRRMSTRILPPAEQERWTAVKMPRGEYKRHHIRDKEGNYAGSEAQRDWDEEDLKREYGAFQEMPIGSVLS
ncbi:hypothetical protein AMS68_005368 [Peltaster fructicola]|uniref:Uncharacterized protein n=1 Tax=Peltaster fructicola TaxID=286661 RepID=A0A6H0XYW1_9PEZI|nr:hypothetical protein AMS68_005368 [Peltaster fructicola]